MNRIPGIFKLHGGKYYLSQKLFAHIGTRYQTFVDLFGGAANMSLNCGNWTSVWYNDLDPFKVSLMCQIRDNPEPLMAALQNLSYCEETFLKAQGNGIKPNDSFLEAAVNCFVRQQMSRGGSAKAFAWSDRLRRGIPGDVSGWFSAIARIPDESRRMHNWTITNSKAMELFDYCVSVFSSEKLAGTLFYFDPPYLPETRKTTGEYGEYEMSYDDHWKLCNTLASTCDGPGIGGLKIAVSGYRSDLYDDYFKNWQRVDIKSVSHAGQNQHKEHRTECLYLSPKVRA